jgi:flavin-dependent dehydrogenase
MHARHRGIWVAWGGPKRFEAFGGDEHGPWSGFHVWRADFDDFLLARAREVGVEVRRPCAVLRVNADGAQVRGVTTASGPVAARVVVDASGRARWLGRALGIDSPARSPRLIARYGYAQGSCPARDDAPMITGDSSGWTWTARVRERTYQWTRLSFDARPDAAWIPDEFRELVPLTRSRGADVTWRMAAEAARPGWFMVGDAATTLDPTSAHGVLKAIMSGIACGHLIAGVLAGTLPPEATATAWREWLNGWFAKDVAQLTQLYRALNSPLFG